MPTHPSTRLLRAVRAERDELARRRRRLAARRDDLAGELARVEAQLRELDDRAGVLDQLAPGPAAVGDEPAPARDVRAGVEPADGRVLLRGTAIREAAVRLLAQRPEGAGSVHYRRWFGLLEEAGFAVAGRDPLATFLTQVTRSPAVRKTTAPGVYELDHGAPGRLRRRVSALQAELRAAADGPRERREKLAAALAAAERQLDEVLRALPEPLAAAS